MSWIVRPGVLRGPVDQTGKLFLVGVGDDAGRFCFLPALDDEDLDVYTISEQVTYSIKIGSDILVRQPGLVNDMPWFAGGEWMLYYHGHAGYLHYVLVSWDRAPGYLPAEYQDPGTEEWFGDTWWSGTVPSALNAWADTTLAPRGLDKADRSTKIAEFHWPRWIKPGGTLDGSEIDEAVGYYSPAPDSGLSGQPTVGVPTWSEGSKVYPRRAWNVGTGNYDYGDNYEIAWDADKSKWILDANIASGIYWQGADVPSFGPALIYRQYDADGIVDGVFPRILTFDGFTSWNETADAWLAECGVVR